MGVGGEFRSNFHKKETNQRTSPAICFFLRILDRGGNTHPFPLMYFEGFNAIALRQRGLPLAAEKLI